MNKSTKKPINVMATSVLAATMLLTPLTSVLPGQASVVHAEETKLDENSKKPQNSTKNPLKVKSIVWANTAYEKRWAIGTSKRVEDVMKEEMLTVSPRFIGKKLNFMPKNNFREYIEAGKLDVISNNENVIKPVPKKGDYSSALSLEVKGIGTSDITFKDKEGNLLKTLTIVVKSETEEQAPKEQAEQDRIAKEAEEVKKEQERLAEAAKKTVNSLFEKVALVDFINVYKHSTELKLKVDQEEINAAQNKVNNLQASEDKTKLQTILCKAQDTLEIRKELEQQLKDIQMKVNNLFTDEKKNVLKQGVTRKDIDTYVSFQGKFYKTVQDAKNESERVAKQTQSVSTKATAGLKYIQQYEAQPEYKNVKFNGIKASFLQADSRKDNDPLYVAKIGVNMLFTSIQYSKYETIHPEVNQKLLDRVKNVVDSLPESTSDKEYLQKRVQHAQKQLNKKIQ